MKKPIILVLCLLFVVCSCKKDQSTPIPTLPTTLFGNWKWMGTYYDYPLGPLNPSTPQNSGVQKSITYTSGLKWKKISTTLPTDSGTFTLGHGIYSPNGLKKYEFDSIQYYRNGVLLKGTVDCFVISNDTLTLSAGLKGLIGSGYTIYTKQGS